jgi:hypothetical protein
MRRIWGWRGGSGAAESYGGIYRAHRRANVGCSVASRYCGGCRARPDTAGSGRQLSLPLLRLLQRQPRLFHFNRLQREILARLAQRAAEAILARLFRLTRVRPSANT